ncbi:MAG: CoA transferase [Thermodesulfobacteriota bacterium]
MEKALDGIRVLDFSHFIAGPFCGMLLGAMGAEVIRIEPPQGSLDREIGPFAPDGRAMYPWHYCCNKKGITLDTRSEKGRQIIRELLAKSDVVIEAFMPPVKKKLGLDFESLQAIDPGLILVSVSGHGQTGPYANRGSFDAIAQGMAGMMAVTGYPGEPPLKSGAAVIDYGTGLYGALGAMLALFHRQKTGRGQAVDVSLLDTAVSFMETAFAEYTVLGLDRKGMGNRRPYTAPTDMFATKDGYVNISVSTDRFWEKFCELTGNEEYKNDPRYSSNRTRYQHQEFLNGLAREWIATRTVSEVVETFAAAGIPAGPVYSIPQVLQDEHIRQREMIVELDYPQVGKVPLPGLAVKLSRTPGAFDRRSPELGEHTQQVLADVLGYDQAQIDELKKAGVI